MCFWIKWFFSNPLALRALPLSGEKFFAPWQGSWSTSRPERFYTEEFFIFYLVPMDTWELVLNEFESVRKILCVPYKTTFRSWFSDFWLLILIYSSLLTVIIWILVVIIMFFVFKHKKIDHPLKSSFKKLLRLWRVFLLNLLVIAVIFFIYYLVSTYVMWDYYC